jgi:hypothetical protein
VKKHILRQTDEEIENIEADMQVDLERMTDQQSPQSESQ